MFFNSLVNTYPFATKRMVLLVDIENIQNKNIQIDKNVNTCYISSGADFFVQLREISYVTNILDVAKL